MTIPTEKTTDTVVPGIPPMEFQDKHKGERCWIIGNGPSARQWRSEDFRELGGVVIGINRSWMPSKDGAYQGFHESDYHVLVSGSHAYDLCNGKFKTRVMFMPRSTRWIVSRPECKGYGKRPEDTEFCFVGVLSGGYHPTRFLYDIDRGIMTKFAGYFALQVAAWMGFTEWFLIGFSAKDREGHAYDDDPGRGIVTRDGMRRWYAGVGDWAEQLNKRRGDGTMRIVNCDPDSAIEWFEKKSRAEVFELCGGG